MPRARRKSPPNRTRATPTQRAAKSRRAKIVWGSLLASMTMVGGLLLVLDTRPAPRVDGLSMAALVASGAPDDIEKIFKTRTPLDRARWQGIVIHHSGSNFGSPASIGAEHEARNFKGLGHHFIIGNGNGMKDGALEAGYRWMEQFPGAHAGGENGAHHNQHSISICLVGDGDRRPMTETQMKQLVKLVGALCRELSISRDKVVLHSEIAPTNDPGRLFPEAAFREALSIAQ